MQETVPLGARLAQESKRELTVVVRELKIMRRFRSIVAFLLATVVAGSLVASRVDAQEDANGELKAIGLYTFFNSGPNAGLKSDEPKLNPVVTAIDVSINPETGKTYFYAGGDAQYFYIRDVKDVEELQNGVAVGDGNQYRAVGLQNNDWIRAISVNPVTGEVATLTQRGQLSIWNPATWEKTKTFDVRDLNGAHAMKYSPNGRILAVCGFDASVRFFGYDGPKPQFDGSMFHEITRWTTPSQSCTALDFHSDRDPATGRCTSTFLAVGGRNAAWVWDVVSGDPPRVFHLTDQDGTTPRRVRAVAFSPNGQLLAVAGDANQIQVWNLATNKPVGISLASREIGDSRDGVRKIFSMTFTDDSTLATGDSVNDVVLWNVETKEMKAIGKGLGRNESKDGRKAHSGTVAALVYVENENDRDAPRSLLSGGFDTLVIRWKLP